MQPTSSIIWLGLRSGLGSPPCRLSLVLPRCTSDATGSSSRALLSVTSDGNPTPRADGGRRFHPLR